MAGKRRAAAEPTLKTFRLKPRQMEFVYSPCQFTLYIGGVGAGKSFAGAVKSILHMINNPGSLGVIGAPTFRMLRETTMRTLMELLPSNTIEKYNKNDQHLVMTNGSEVLFHSMDEPDRSRGLNLGWFWLDEAPLCSYYAWQVLKARLRQKGAKLGGWGTGTPKGKDGYYHDFEGDPLPDHLLVRASTFENQSNLPPGYIESLGYSGAFYEQEVLGKFEAFDGLVYTFEANPADPNTHLKTAHRFKQFKRVIGGVDWGYQNPAVAIVVGIDGDDRAWVLKEFYERHVQLDQHIATLIEMTRSYGVTEWYCDPAEPGNIATFSTALDANKLDSVARKGNNDITAGIQTVTRCLSLRGDNTYGLYVDPSCRHLIAEFGSYQYATKESSTRNANEKPIKQNDHACDAIRYALHSVLGEGRGGNIPTAVTHFSHPKSRAEMEEDGELPDDPEPAWVEARRQFTADIMRRFGLI